MGEWTEKTWGEVLTLQRGFDITKKEQDQDGKVPVVSSGGISSYHNEFTSDGPGVVMGRKGTLGRVYYLAGPFWAHDTTLWVKDFKGNHPRFVYYALQSIDPINLDVGSASPTLNRNHVHPIPVRWPNRRTTQRAIAEVLGALDDKIAANDSTVKILQRLSQALYDRALTDGCIDISLDEAAEFHNRRRIPLSGREREMRPGNIPYYGAAGQLGTVDEALFDDVLILVGEDGSVMKPDGRPVTQYIWGPSWVNNHAHVLTGALLSTDALRWAINRSNVAHLVTGAVQPKISMTNLKSLALSVPVDTESLNQRLGPLSGLERLLITETRILAATRDQLLPLLMSGKITVKDAEERVADAL